MSPNDPNGASPARSTAGHTNPGSKKTTGLKLVTVAPGTSGSLGVPTVAAPTPEQIAPTSRPPPPNQEDPYLGCTIDNRYKVEAILGEGGMGVVYQCRHKIIDKKVALKILRPDLARDKEVTERFLIEARAASAIGSEHIIDISDFGQLPDGSAYFVMEFLDGDPLSAELTEGNPLPLARLLAISRQLAEGLSGAHNAGIVHRDLKPDNIFLVRRHNRDDFVKILDFGIAKVSTGATGKLTQAGSVFGTPHYMSPEQAAGAPVDHRGDIYSFGVILYELASGRVPFDADNFMGILTQHMYKAPVPIRALVPPPPNVPPGLEAVILKCLSKRPEQRYQSMVELNADLERLEKGEVPEAVAEMMERSGGFNVPADYFLQASKVQGPVPATPAELSNRRSRWPLVVGLAAPLLIVAGIFFAQSRNSTASSTAEVAATAEPTTPTTEPLPPTAEQPATVQVVVAIDPLEAHAFAGDQDLGSSPVLVDVPLDEKVDLEIREDGYKSQALTLDGTKTKITVKLEPSKPEPQPKTVQRPRVVRPRPPPAPKKSGNKTLGGGEIVNPWAK